MDENNKKVCVSRTTLFVAVVCAALMLGLPSFADDGKFMGAVDNAAALDDVDRLFTIGTAELTISTLNPFQYTMADEYMVIWPCYSTMLTYSLDLELEGDLAKSWDVSDDGLTWTFEIVNNAYFCDPSEPTVENPTRKVTVDDVIYTYNIVQDFKSNLHFYFPGPVDGSGIAPTISSMTADDDYNMTLVLDHAYAPFVGALASIPIIPKYYWEPQEDGSGDPTKWSQALPVGSGPFYYTLSGLPTAGEATMARNPIWVQEKNRGWQLHVDTLKLKDMTDASTAWLELQLGNIDCMMGVSPSVYTGDLPDEDDIIGFAQSTGFVYEFNLNQLTEEMRDELGWTGGKDAWNNQILLDPVVKEAFAMCIDKEVFIEEVLEGLGTYADSLIPDVNPWYHRYENPVSFNTAAARQMLMDAGWNLDAAGNPATATETPLYGFFEGELQPLEFRFCTLSDVPEWQIGADLIQDWCAEGGILLNLELKSPNQMNTIWYTGQYDTWLWDWIFTPMSDPSTDVLSVLTTMEIGSWSDVYMSDPEFDSLYNESLVAMDPVARQLIVDEMQNVAYEDFSCQCIAYRKELYAVSTLRWDNYGDWEDQFMLMPDQGLPHLYMMISPSGPNAADPPNQAPVITSLDDSFEGYIDAPIDFTGSATDGSVTLEYQWYWGDGKTSGWLSSPATTHTYAEDGYYDIYFAARESSDADTADYFITWDMTTAKVIDASNTAPHSLTIEFDPPSPDMGDVVTFTGTAEDDDGDELEFSWAFGDMYSARGSVATHQYPATGSYTVTLSVTDNRVGEQARPVTTNALVVVTGNSPPTIDVPDFADVLKDVSYDFSVTASDPDSDPLRYTWDWGDGSVTVTDTDTASHTYTEQTSYTLTVYADDLTGVDGHNVSDTGDVTVMSSTNTAPVIVSFDSSKSDPYTGEEITFTGVATDVDGDGLRFTFEFGDGTFAVMNNPTTAPDAEVEFTVSHTYETAETVTAYLYVWDFQDNTTSPGETLTIVANAEPLFDDPPYLTVLANTTVDFSVDPFDADGDDMIIWWDFGDESPLESGTSVSHMYIIPDEYVYSVSVNDSHGHNVTKSAIITVNSEDMNQPPEIVALENMTAFVFEVVEFAATATDPNDDVLVYTWDFGDDSDLAVGQTVEHAYDAADEYTFAVYVDDGEFNETASASITVNASDPPVADAGPNQTVAAGDDVTFNGAGSSDDVGVVNYTWTFTYSGSAVTLYGVSPEHTFAVAGSYNVTLTVMDAEDQTATDSVLITVEETDDDKSWIDSYGLPLGIALALIAAVAVTLLVMKGKKGGKTPSSTEVEGQPMAAESEEQPAPPADEQ